AIYDTPVTLGAKSHLRGGRPVLIALSTNDGLTASAGNIGRLLNTKNVYLLPFGQDDAEKKPASLTSQLSRLPEAVEAALEGRQLQPVVV
ncbi:MAG: dipicolinate synthase subunit B, partial [Ruminococcus sp.]|nr:dipicolinate synthase subunit B [Ruminococcus sp.]